MKKVYIKRNDLFKNINMVLCNNIANVDESFIEDNGELFNIECTECNGTGEVKNKRCEECTGEGSYNVEPYQYFLCDIDNYTADRLKKYGVKIGYSDLLDLSVIAIYDFGTSWSIFSYSKEVEDNYILSSDETLERQTHY